MQHIITRSQEGVYCHGHTSVPYKSHVRIFMKRPPPSELGDTYACSPLPEPPPPPPSLEIFTPPISGIGYHWQVKTKQKTKTLSWVFLGNLPETNAKNTPFPREQAYRPLSRVGVGEIERDVGKCYIHPVTTT